ncbi:MAG TPA: helix-turn-helix transcriptional regulator [Terriglobia bacterium]|nr:helix-turn-helix transcriptional regulator [Terriglobia bacterium]
MVQDFLPLNHADFQIMLALADGERHGYGIMLDVAELTGGRTKLGPGTLYTSIKRLRQAELIEESDDRPDPKLDDERRRYYRLTKLGRKVLVAESERLENLLSYARGRRILKQA